MLAHKPEVVQMLLHHSADVYIADEVGWADVDINAFVSLCWQMN